MSVSVVLPIDPVNGYIRTLQVRNEPASHGLIVFMCIYHTVLYINNYYMHTLQMDICFGPGTSNNCYSTMNRVKIE